MDAVEVGRRSKLGQFRTPAAKARFEKAYDAALALWPLPPTAIDVPTRFGTTRVNACGTSTATPIVMLPACPRNLGVVGAERVRARSPPPRLRDPTPCATQG